MKANDLRLGNWLYESDRSKFPMQVYAVGNNWVQLDFEGNEGDCFEHNDKELYPIPISAELIAKILPQEGIESIHKYVSIINVRFRLSGNKLYLLKDGKLYSMRVEVHYVHELQNLYYTLNGKELKINREWL